MTLWSANASRRRRGRRRAVRDLSPAQLQAADGRLAAELDALLGSGVLLDRGALERLRAVIDEVALPAAAAYERQLREPAA